METSRVEAFSDGVFAIAITLLILAVGIDRAPHGDLGEYLLDLWPAYLAYAVQLPDDRDHVGQPSPVLRQLRRVDRPLLLLNILLLMLIAFVPFPTRHRCRVRPVGLDRRNRSAPLRDHDDDNRDLSSSLSGCTGRAGCCARTPIRVVVSGITRSYLPGAPLYATATLLAFVSSIASLVMFAAIALFYALSARVIRAYATRPWNARLPQETRTRRPPSRAGPSALTWCLPHVPALPHSAARRRRREPRRRARTPRSR